VKYAICNETYGDLPHELVCERVAAAGYTGLEIAPYTLAPLITQITPTQRAVIRRTAEAAGLHILGLHWLFAKTTDFGITSPEEATRRATSAYLVELTRCCAELGGTVLVLGSPMVRNIPPGCTRGQATANALLCLDPVLDILSDTGVTLALEPLTLKETDFLNTAGEAVDMIEQLGSPMVRLHLDVKAMTAEPVSAADTIRKYAGHLAHFHANDPNLRGPGFGDTCFRPILAALAAAQYTGYISVEVFDYSPDADTIAERSLAYLRHCESPTLTPPQGVPR